jgi:STE24 endopeptidase
MYFADMGKQLTLGVVIGMPLLLLVLWVTDRMGEYWWFWVWLVWITFNLLILMVYPTLIAPIFNKFSPLMDENLRHRIDNLVHRCGFESKGVYVMDGSRRSSHGNAYFTGFGSNRRIVLFDTLIARLEAAELEAVLAHELGHFAKRHVLKRIAMIFAGSLVVLSVLGALRNTPWFYSAFGIDTASTAMTFVLFFMVMPSFLFPIQPIASLYSRKQEYEADAYAALHSESGDLIHALVKLYKDNASTLTPDPLYSAFHDSHPPASLRIARLRAAPSA